MPKIHRNGDWAHLRLTDRIAPGVRVLLVGINPGVRSAQTGHHFAGPSNRFWKLLYDSRLVPEPIGYEEDERLPEWGLGITNLVARPSPGIDDLRPQEYLDGWETLKAKIERFHPSIVAFVGVTFANVRIKNLMLPPGPDGSREEGGVTLYRALWRVLGHERAPAIKLGRQRATIHGARVFVLPNPSGRNANFSYAEMLAAFRSLRRAL